ncbi:hypothetical protein RIF29_41147 [Crotalaria pallida]|uniref:Xylanase inhibitor N-terminal domain-containing protein n=1 Tax=Crotalaria pallida TaxID=3830 RepID=A0AAN9E0F1_CROPI
MHTWIARFGRTAASCSIMLLSALATHQGPIFLILTLAVTSHGFNVMPLVLIALRPSNDLVPCRHHLCASLQQTDNYNCENPSQCDYEVEYADHYSSLGVLVNDFYLLNFTDGNRLRVRMSMGLVTLQAFLYYLKSSLLP